MGYDEISFQIYFSTHVCALPGILNSVVIIIYWMREGVILCKNLMCCMSSNILLRGYNYLILRLHFNNLISRYGKIQFVVSWLYHWLRQISNQWYLSHVHKQKPDLFNFKLFKILSSAQIYFQVELSISFLER